MFFLTASTVCLWSDSQNFSVMFFFSVIAHEFDEDCTQESEYERLDESDEEFDKIEGESGEKSEFFGREGHQLFKRLLATVDVSKETEGEGNGANED